MIMSEKNINQEFRLKNIHETTNYLIEEVNKNELMSKKHKKFYRVLNYIEHLLILISAVNDWVFISAFASLVGFPIGITSSAIGLQMCVITAGINKEYNCSGPLAFKCQRVGCQSNPKLLHHC